MAQDPGLEMQHPPPQRQTSKRSDPDSVLGAIDSVAGGSFVGNWLIRVQGETLAGQSLYLH